MAGDREPDALDRARREERREAGRADLEIQVGIAPLSTSSTIPSVAGMIISASRAWFEKTPTTRRIVPREGCVSPSNASAS